eukprot:TRINITY_DN23009_c0_g1_i1.p1 TRINITY_DN23009_c0_g1~~TRINITY_DN23009_c0_g1_i1.p1  ORF type:complete len:294 (+),score=80.13 TRINITY_DN23009_c0_g1_i1:91-972(+)
MAGGSAYRVAVRLGPEGGTHEVPCTPETTAAELVGLIRTAAPSALSDEDFAQGELTFQCKRLGAEERLADAGVPSGGALELTPTRWQDAPRGFITALPAAGSARDWSENTRRVVVLGGCGSGKSSIVNLWATGRAGERPSSGTVGVDLLRRCMLWRGAHPLRIEFVEGPGHWIQRATSVHAALRGADAVVVTYDLRDREAFEQARTFLEIIAAGRAHHLLGSVLIGAKDDDRGTQGGGNRRAVSRAEGIQLAAQTGADFAEISSHTGSGTERALEMVAERCLLRHPIGTARAP